MKLSYVIIAVVLAVVAVYFVSQRSGATEITRTGDDLSIAVGDHRIQATVAGPEFTESFFVIGGMRSHNLHFSAFLSVIPLATAEALAEQYGDFRRCSSPGAAAGKASVETMVFYTANGSVERTLKRVNKLALAGKDPVVEVTFYLMDITDHKMVKRGHEFDLPLFDIGPCFVAKDARLIRKGL